MPPPWERGFEAEDALRRLVMEMGQKKCCKVRFPIESRVDVIDEFIHVPRCTSAPIEHDPEMLTRTNSPRLIKGSVAALSPYVSSEAAR
jgi:hypothetical protein